MTLPFCFVIDNFSHSCTKKEVQNLAVTPKTTIGPQVIHASVKMHLDTDIHASKLKKVSGSGQNITLRVNTDAWHLILSFVANLAPPTPEYFT